MLKKIALGLSGGVDSAVAAVLLQQRGYEVCPFYIVCWQEPGCRAEQDRTDALKVALQLNLPFQVLDFKVAYHDKVMNYFYSEYKKGRTPNPDVLCNREIKFGLFYDWARANGFDYIATGHYAKTDNNFLFTAKDLNKDQSYFLYQLKQEQLEHILFPIGDYLKEEIRKIAKEKKLIVADKKDSMGICFVGNINVRQLLAKKFGIKKGEVVLQNGTVIGEHDGYWFFNRGHRGGWRRKFRIQNDQFKNDDLPKLYVIGINKKENKITVGEREACLQDEFVITEIHWINKNFDLSQRLWVKIRNTGDFLKAKLNKIEGNQFKVRLEEKTFAVSPGQSCVIYSKVENQESYQVLGGGIIS
ncbi:tRNA 2-thiouridine(34) synthase MnmA [Candidatus Beckwithbacteria bacterium]|nr:tRNA 2-thiouridine(34) synthase MnmA [Candidatus Beckwithbacteria bacterium]